MNTAKICSHDAYRKHASGVQLEYADGERYEKSLATDSKLPSRAIRLLQDHLNERPEHAGGSWSDLGVLHYNDGDLAAARNYLERALSIDPINETAEAYPSPIDGVQKTLNAPRHPIVR